MSAHLLEELTAKRYDYAPATTARKLELLAQLGRRRLPDADCVEELHETLCVMRAYAEIPAIRTAVDGLLADFHERGDLKRFRKALADTGIAGTEVRFRFFWLMAIRMAARWPEAIRIDWREFENKDKLLDLLSLLVPYSETPGLDSAALDAREWIELLKGPDETDAAFLVRRFAALDADSAVREKLFDDLDAPFVVAPGPTTPARGREGWPRSPIVPQKQPPSPRRPSDFKKEIRRARVRVRSVDRRQSRELIELANTCMVSRHRDLLIFLYADERDVRVVECGDGLQFACVGAVPSRRLMLESVYGFLTLKNGVPIGYVLCSALFNSSEVAYNIFESFRGAGAAQVYAQFLAAVRAIFGVDTFALDPYQLGHENEEGQRSGAWWFYYKLGFRPHDPYVKELVHEERAAMKADPGHRTSLRRLNELASEYMFLHLGRPRRDVLGHIDLGNIGLRISAYLAQHFGADRERGLKECADEARKLLGLRAKLSREERLVWERWSPLALALPGVRRWTANQKRGLRDIMRAKGGRRESDYVRLVDAHPKLRGALLELSHAAP